MEALIWIARGHERAALTEEPAQCPAAAGQAADVAAGRALFNAPQLLGGQASRARMNCATCHANGRVNAHFYLAGVSAQPGTADVSASFFSLARADGRFDPKPIPDLAEPGKVSRDPSSGALEHFIRGLIVEEFDGREPSPAELGALAAYVRSIRACPGRAQVPRTMAEPIGLIRDSVRAAAQMAERHETEAATILVSAARYQLGLVNERLVGPDFHRQRAMLLRASRELQPMADARAPDPLVLQQWLTGFDRDVVPALLKSEPRSLYNPARVARLWGADR